MTPAPTALAAAVTDPTVSYGTADTLSYSGLAVSGPTAAGGTVTFRDADGDTLCVATLPDTSCATAADLEPGTYDVTASYSGDGDHAAGTATTRFVVSEAATAVQAGVTDASVVFGSSTTLTWAGLPTSPAAATGTVTFTSGGATLCTATLPDTSCATSATLAAGTYPVTATYSGDDHYTGSTDTTSFQVTTAGSTSFTAAATPTSATYGDPVTLSHAGLDLTGADAATGTVTFTSGGETLCVATLPDTACAAPADLDVGTYPVTATYSGDANHDGATDTTAFEVTKVATTVVAAATSPSVTFGTTNTLSYSGPVLTGPTAATGTVTFTAGGETLCVATLPATSTTAADLGAGSYAVTATYSGDANHDGDSDTAAFEVTKAATTLTAYAAFPSVPFGAPDPLAVTGLPAGATGTVTFTSGGTTLCTATLPETTCDALAGLHAGTYPVVATYSGDANHDGDTDTTSFTVTRAATALGATVASPVVSKGTREVLTASGLPAGATGTVVFTAGGRTLCTVTLPDTACRTAADLALGRYDVTATYSGDGDHSGSTATARFRVEAVATTTRTTTTPQGTPVTVPVPGASTADSITVVGTPAHGTATVRDGALVFSPDDGFVGTTTVTLRVVDEDGTVTVVTVRVVVTAADSGTDGGGGTGGSGGGGSGGSDGGDEGSGLPAVADGVATLPRTGSDLVLWTLVGAGLVTVGAVAVRTTARPVRATRAGRADGATGERA
ncbi:hypothetical protein GCM10025868_12830 [Angustibacter aerolatus]|uniref:Bacterial Ig-like domain-containing protein n=1 Tax=Angustibacter aerolatus TaxID=1162965 RepID=A0ABQ6JCW6_9ACTN|nr:Ig-like domain-containing protein [Angustibacter aerolatus]GMA86033.1 hypothetical protein GCM10025868_12830 [Angustibacter aerolatus]